MNNFMLYKRIINKKTEEVIRDIKNKASDFNFIIRNIFDMAQNFKDHGVAVDANFKYYSIMLCNPRKAYQSILAKNIRGAVLLPPKQVVVYPESENKTCVAYEAPDMDRLEKIMPDDKKFQESLYSSGQKIIELLDSLS